MFESFRMRGWARTKADRERAAVQVAWRVESLKGRRLLQASLAARGPATSCAVPAEAKGVQRIRWMSFSPSRALPCGFYRYRWSGLHELESGSELTPMRFFHLDIEVASRFLDIAKR